MEATDEPVVPETSESRANAFFDLLALLDEKDPLAALRRHRARVDDQFAAAGQYRFTIAGVAGLGSELVFPKAPAASPSITVRPPAELRVTPADVEARFGPAKRLPALPNEGWRYSYGPGGHILAAYSSNPSQPTSVLLRLRRRLA